jgi:hypothetical protein
MKEENLYLILLFIVIMLFDLTLVFISGILWDTTNISE